MHPQKDDLPTPKNSIDGILSNAGYTITAVIGVFLRVLGLLIVGDDTDA
jgi:hypothetical protein